VGSYHEKYVDKMAKIEGDIAGKRMSRTQEIKEKIRKTYEHLASSRIQRVERNVESRKELMELSKVKAKNEKMIAQYQSSKSVANRPTTAAKIQMLEIQNQQIETEMGRIAGEGIIAQGKELGRSVLEAPGYVYDKAGLRQAKAVGIKTTWKSQTGGSVLHPSDILQVGKETQKQQDLMSGMDRYIPGHPGIGSQNPDEPYVDRTAEMIPYRPKDAYDDSEPLRMDWNSYTPTPLFPISNEKKQRRFRR
jgi:hypothetical protein